MSLSARGKAGGRVLPFQEWINIICRFPAKRVSRHARPSPPVPPSSSSHSSLACLVPPRQPPSPSQLHLKITHGEKCSLRVLPPPEREAARQGKEGWRAVWCCRCNAYRIIQNEESLPSPCFRHAARVCVWHTCMWVVRGHRLGQKGHRKQQGGRSGNNGDTQSEESPTVPPPPKVHPIIEERRESVCGTERHGAWATLKLPCPVPPFLPTSMACLKVHYTHVCFS